MNIYVYINTIYSSNTIIIRDKLIYNVRKLRKKGETYGYIQKTLGVTIPKSTLFYWCKDIILPADYKEKIKQLNLIQLKKIRPLALLINSQKRKKYLASLLKRNTHLLEKIDIPIQKLLLAILYLGEGAKHKSSQMLTLGSSDEKIIKFYLKLLKNCYNTDESKFRVRIQCRFDQNKKSLEEFWQNITKIKKEQFYPTYVDKRTQSRPTLKKDYRGVCTVHYFSTEIQLELELLAGAVINKII